MKLTPQQHDAVARRAQWYFDCHFGAAAADSVVFTGDGVDDLDALIARLEANAVNNLVHGQRFLCDVGAQYAIWRPFDVADVQAIRARFVAVHGEVIKPDVYA